MTKCGFGKLIIVTTQISIFLLVVIFLLLFLQSDEYRIHKYLMSPTGKGVGVIVANDGGGAGTGWCRDLVYKFPDSTGPIPDITKERKNEKYLVALLDCGEAKNISWRGSELRIMK